MKLSATTIAHLNQIGKYADGNGLYLFVSKSKSKSWVYRYQVNQQRREMGLGSYPILSLKDARLKRDRLKVQVNDGFDPLAERLREREKAKIYLSMTFAKLSEDCFEELKPSFKNKKHQQQWINTLRTYAYPLIGDLPLKEITPRHIKAILDPIWLTKCETARRVRQRIEKVWYWGKFLGYCSGDNPALKKGNLEYVLPKQPLYHQTHHSALPYPQLPSFWKDLQAIKCLSSVALQWLILTATRTSEVLYATWKEIDLDQELWIIPKDRTKTGREYRIPLCFDALEFLNNLQTNYPSDHLLFTNGKNKVLSDMSMLMLMRSQFPSLQATPHGFRSSFRDWGETSNTYSPRALEYALGHLIKNKVESAYQRDDLLLIRRSLMKDWAHYLNRGQFIKENQGLKD